MKNIVLLIAILIASSTFFKAHASELPVKAKQIIFNAIAEFVYFEDDGFERIPRNIDDFKYTISNESEITVTGTSYSEWDLKDLEYKCLINILTRGMIKTDSDIEIEFCELENENWPHM